MKFKVYLLFVFLPVFLSCTDKKTASFDTITVNIGKGNDRQASLFQIMGDVKFIALENTKDAFLSTVSRAYKYKDKFYVFDNLFNKIAVFSDQGDFLYTIGQIGKAPGQYGELNDMAMDYKGKRIQILEINENRILNYSLKGEYIDYFQTDFPINNFVNLDSEYYGFFVGNYAQKPYNLRITDMDHTVLARQFKFPQNPKEPLMGFGFTGNLTWYKDNFLYTPDASSKIYQVSPNGKIGVKYKFDFGAAQWPDDKLFLHKTFFRKVKHGQLSFLSTYMENDKALVFYYNFSSANSSVKHPASFYLGFYLKKEKKTVDHFNFKNAFLYAYLSAPKGKTRDGRYFISTLKNIDKLKTKLAGIDDPKGFAKRLKSLVGPGFNPETTVLVLYSLK